MLYRILNVFFSLRACIFLVYRAEGALSIESPENIVENTFVLKKRKDFTMAFRKLVRVCADLSGMSDCILHLPQVYLRD